MALTAAPHGVRGTPRRWPALVVAGAGLLAALMALGARLAHGPPSGKAAAWVEVASALGLLAGGALLAGGLLGLLFVVATRRSFEWYVAWRYLRDEGRRRSWSTLVVGCVLAVVAAGLYVAARLWGRIGFEELVLGTSPVVRLLQGLALGTAVVANLAILFGVLLLFFSLFTSISIFGVYLGIAALVVVLSVMGGFENDLRQKILGTNAHVVITKPSGVFQDYQAVLEQVARTPGVLAYSPFVESEVMVTSQSNLSGVLLKGIDPRLIGQVTDLRRYLRAGSGAGRLEDLLHPERLARIPEARFRPMVTEPLGEPPDADHEAGGGSPGPAPAGKGKKTGKTEGGDRHDEEDAADRTEKGSSPGHDASAGADADELDVRRTIAQLEEKRRRLERLIKEAESQVGKKVPPRPVYPGIIIGAELAKNLRLYVGDDVNVVAPLGGMSPAGPIPKSKPFRVAGIFYSGMYEYDTKFVYVTIPAAQRFLGLDGEVTGIEIKARRVEDAPQVAAALSGQLGSRGLRVQDWRQVNVSLFDALKLEKFVMFVVLTFIVIVAAFSIVTNLIMVVLSKTRDIAALKTMGVSPWSALKIFFSAGLYIGVIGMLLGVLTGVGICLFLHYVGLPLDPEVYYISELPVRMSPVDIASVGLAGVFLSFLATLYPSLVAARLRPVDGLRRYEA
jgi:lipoprotein-releasing system permease protein